MDFLNRIMAGLWPVNHPESHAVPGSSSRPMSEVPAETVPLRRRTPSPESIQRPRSPAPFDQAGKERSDLKARVSGPPSPKGVDVSLSPREDFSTAPLPGRLKTDVPAAWTDLNVIGYQGVRHDGPPGGSTTVYARCADGQVRRFPPAGHISVTAERLLNEGWVMDAPADSFKRKGGFDVDVESGRVTYTVEGTPVASTGERQVAPSRLHVSVMADPDYQALWKVQAYPLAPGRWMIPQPDGGTCASACEAALCMSAGMTFRAASRGFRMERYVKPGSDLASLKGRTGIDPLEVAAPLHGGQPSPGDLRALQQNLRDHGPAVLGRNGHSCMLYELSLDPGGVSGKAVIGDPFHGTYGEVEFGPGKTALWSPPGPIQEAFIRTVFLPKGQLDVKLDDIRKKLLEATGPEPATTFVSGVYLKGLRTACKTPLGAHKMFKLLGEALDPARSPNSVRGEFLKTVVTVETKYLADASRKNVRDELWRPLVGKAAHDFRVGGGDFSALDGVGPKTQKFLAELADDHAAGKL